MPLLGGITLRELLHQVIAFHGPLENMFIGTVESYGVRHIPWNHPKS